MKANTSLPSNYSEHTILEPSKNPKFVIGAVVTGIALLLISAWLLVLFINTLRPTALDGMRLRAPIAFVPFLLFFVAINASGAAGDIIMVFRLMLFSADTVMEDNDAGVTIYGPKGNKNAA